MRLLFKFIVRTIMALTLFALVMVLSGAAFMTSIRETIPNITEPQSPIIGTMEPAFSEAIHQSRADINSVRQEKYYPSLSVSVFHQGREQWSESIGYEDLENQKAATPETLYPFGSIGKPMTAALTMQLVADGVVDLDTPIQQYVPTLPKSHRALTLRQLLSHQAGIRHYNFALIPPFFTENAMNKEFGSSEDSIAIFIDDPLLFEADTAFAYSTFGYTLVGYVLEKATGTPFLKLMDERLFGPLSLDRTVPDRANPRANGRTTDYLSIFQGWGAVRSPQTNVSYKWAGGGFLSTPSELAQFGDAMLRHQYIDAASFEEMTTPRQVSNGEINRQSYGLGWRSGNLRSEETGALTPIFHHGGTSAGAECALLLHADFNLTIAVCGNAFTGGSGDLLRLAADLAQNFQKTLDQ